MLGCLALAETEVPTNLRPPAPPMIHSSMRGFDPPNSRRTITWSVGPSLRAMTEHTRAEASRGPLHSVGTGARVRSYPTIP